FAFPEMTISEHTFLTPVRPIKPGGWSAQRHQDKRRRILRRCAPHPKARCAGSGVAAKRLPRRRAARGFVMSKSRNPQAGLADEGRSRLIFSRARKEPERPPARLLG